jgi:Zn-dependent protease with chaperone function
MVAGGVVSLSFTLLLGGFIVAGLGHGMLQRSWVAAAALLVYLVTTLGQAGWREGQPILFLLAGVIAYFLVQGLRALWWSREHEVADAPPA